MGAPYSQDLRLRVLSAIDQGMNKMAAHKTFRVSRSTIDDWMKLRLATGAVSAKTRRARIGARAIQDMKAFESFAWRHQGATLTQMASCWEQETGQKLSRNTFSVMLRRLGWTHKKRVGFMPSAMKANEFASSSN